MLSTVAYARTPEHSPAHCAAGNRQCAALRRQRPGRNSTSPYQARAEAPVLSVSVSNP